MSDVDSAAIGQQLDSCVTVCVGYDDLLKAVVQQNARHFKRWLIVTAPKPHDDRTTWLVEYAKQLVAPRCELSWHATDVFYRDGAAFNKGAAIEEAFDVVGRAGWMAVMDADIALPVDFGGFPLDSMNPDHLHVPKRRHLREPQRYWPGFDWSGCPTWPEEHGGWLQVFHADSPPLGDSRPWYPTAWKHAGGCDSGFALKWKRRRREWLPFEVLHLGEDGVNWCGRATARIDNGERHPDADEKVAMLKAFQDGRERGANRFKGERLDGLGGVR